ncbi:MAG: class I SAM-dependent methyltransferase [Thermodesulfobacteriota bacterium]
MELRVVEQTSANSSTKYCCPNCSGNTVLAFYKVDNVPVHSVLLLNSRDEAINYPKGKIELGFCKSCGFISNTAFNPEVHEYYSEYESSQAFSPTFNSFSKKLAELLISRHSLNEKEIIEIGCGQGEFLKLICGLGKNRGIGFDPAYNESRSSEVNIDSNGFNADVSIIKDFYSEKYSDYHADFICCKMTLEHIQDTASFVSSIRRSITNNSDTGVFFQIPEASRVLDEIAFWDIYYEHCSYFSPVSLAKLFKNNGFDITNLGTDYEDQYLMIEALPGQGEIQFKFNEDEQLSQMSAKVDYFVKNYPRKLDEWNGTLNDIKEKGLKSVVWGSSSKGVAFLTTLDAGHDEIEYVVDINPYRQGSFMAGTGQEIVSPEFLKEYKPDLIIVMNPIYTNEIKKGLVELQLSPDVITV